MLFAVHISDGVLTMPWLVGGFVAAFALLWLGTRRIHEEEIPRIAILAAAFFVSSSIHIRIGMTSMHLLLVGLVGVVLGIRSVPAIFIGLVLQLLLLEHGGRWTLGVNTCVMAVPALLSWLLFHGLRRVRWLWTPVGRGVLMAIAGFAWFLSGVYSVTLMCSTSLSNFEWEALDAANAWIVDPWILVAAFLFGLLAAFVERRLENTPEFPLGFLIGELSVLLTAGLNGAVLMLGGEVSGSIWLVLVIAHLPIALIEGLIVGFVVGYLARVKPEMLGSVKEPRTR